MHTQEWVIKCITACSSLPSKFKYFAVMLEKAGTAPSDTAWKDLLAALQGNISFEKHAGRFLALTNLTEAPETALHQGSQIILARTEPRATLAKEVTSVKATIELYEAATQLSPFAPGLCLTAWMLTGAQAKPQTHILVLVLHWIVAPHILRRPSTLINPRILPTPARALLHQ